MSEKKLKKLEDDILDLKNQNNALKHEITFLKNVLIKRNLLNFENENYCPICDEFSVFNSFSVHFRKNVRCPKCKSLERQRLVYILFLQRFDYIFRHEPIKLLHFAPEEVFYDYFTKFPNIDYVTVDFNPEVYEARNIKIKQKVNMESIPYDNETFDFIYNSHVLEHVPNDIQGMRELYRVLKEDGFCITLAPIFNIPETLEKEEYNTPELRLKYYGQEDHVRKYGLDFKNRLESVGFNVEEIKPEDIVKTHAERQLFKFYGDTIFLCTK